MASTDAKAIPVKGAAYRLTFPILDADGDLQSGASSLDSEVSIDGGAFADCTNEATEIATSSGMYYLDLTSSEMNGDTIAVIVKTGTAGAKTTPIVLYPAARSINDLAFPATSGRSMVVDASGLVDVNVVNAGGAAWGSGAITAASIAADAITAAKIADGAIDAATFAAGAINAAAIASDAITDAKVASDVTIASVTGSVGSVTGNVGGNVAGSVGSVTAGVTLADDAITSAKFDESTAFPLKSADSGATQVARVGADGDTLETLSDQLDTKASQASVDDLPTNSELATALASADDATLAAIAGLENLSQAEAQAAANAALLANHLDHLLAVSYDPQSKPGDPGALLNELVESDDASPGRARFTAGALEEAPTGGSAPTAAEIADAVWDEDLTGHTTPDSAGDTLGSVATGTPPTASAIADAVWDEARSGHVTSGSFGEGVASVQGNVTGSIGSLASQAKADVNAEADTALSDVGVTSTVTGRIDVAVSTRLATSGYTAPLDAAGVRTAVGLASANLDTQLGDVPTNAELATALASADDAVLAAIAALNNLSQANIRTAVGLASANLDTQLDALPTNSELTSALAAADDAVLAAIAALNNLSQANIRTAVGLGSANLDTQLDALPTNAELATALAAADDAVLAAIAALNNLSAAQVNAQVVDALATDTYAEPSAVPAATASLVDKINWLAALARNKVTQTSTTQTLRNDGDTANMATAAVSDNGTTFERAEWQ